MTFEAIALICTLGQAPQDCLPQTARAVEKIAEGPTEMACAVQAVKSSGGAIVKPGDGEYLKIMCVRR